MQPFAVDDDLEKVWYDILLLFSAEERMRGLSPEERLKGLSPEDLPRALTPEDKECLRLLLQQSQPKEGDE
jgi:hypothetical protein